MSFDIVDILSKLNKAALFFFLATVAFLAYEFYLFRKERMKKGKLKVPQFSASNVSSAPPVVQKSAPAAAPQFSPPPLKRKGNKGILIVFVSIIALGIVGLLTYRLNSTTEQDASVAPVNPRAADETVPSDLTGDATASAQTDATASGSAQTTTTADTSTEATGSSLLADANTSATTDTGATTSAELASAAGEPSPTPTTEVINTSSESVTETPTETPTPTSAASETTATPTTMAELPVTADNTSVPYTLFIFLAAIITFFVAFLY